MIFWFESVERACFAELRIVRFMLIEHLLPKLLIPKAAEITHMGPLNSIGHTNS